MANPLPTIRRGASWLIEDVDPAEVFTPEKLSDDQRLVAQTTDEFLAREVVPQLDRLEQKDWGLARSLLRRFGALGLLGADVPAAYGGTEFDKATALVVNQHMSACASFAVMAGAQANLAVTPILLFGTEEQKQRYLPGLVSGELVGAYALSEVDAGSDALNARTVAVQQPDGSYALTGEKMWITNGGFADLFVVFAKAGGEQFSAFIVERGLPGVSSGAEEHKMGLLGSSTTPLVLQDARVPAANLLGGLGNGRKVAYTVLNSGRFELGATCAGGAAIAVGEAARYAVERRQFGRPIASFGAIRHKLAQMSARTYAVESLVYRIAGLLDAFLQQPERDASDPLAVVAALQEYGIEASIAKVAGSEALDYVLDENVQIHGGNGFVRDLPPEGRYRDARVNRIFEGTNEINRLLIPGVLLRKTAVRRAARAERRGSSAPSAPAAGDRGTAESSHDGFAAELQVVSGCKRSTLRVLGVAVELFGERIAEEQEVLMNVADLAIDAFAAESSLLRAIEACRLRAASASLHDDAAGIIVDEAAAGVLRTARRALAAMLDGDRLNAELGVINTLVNVVPRNMVEPSRRIADETAARGRYLFQ
jgi:alkylation response protein AidB-like acyl-CoA dehydrogenase